MRVFDTKFHMWVEADKEVIFDSIRYTLTDELGENYDCITEDEFFQRCESREITLKKYYKNLKQKNKTKEDIQIAIYEVIEMLMDKPKNFDKIRAHVAMLEEMQRRLDAIGKNKEE